MVLKLMKEDGPEKKHALRQTIRTPFYSALLKPLKEDIAEITVCAGDGVCWQQQKLELPMADKRCVSLIIGRMNRYLSEEKKHNINLIENEEQVTTIVNNAFEEYRNRLINLEKKFSIIEKIRKEIINNAIKKVAQENPDYKTELEEYGKELADEIKNLHYKNKSKISQQIKLETDRLWLIRDLIFSDSYGIYPPVWLVSMPMEYRKISALRTVISIKKVDRGKVLVDAYSLVPPKENYKWWHLTEYKDSMEIFIDDALILVLHMGYSC
ncbi:MAG: hypothetical protein QXF86_03610 [Candidatus Bilamarchaeaceae archaeon]